MSNVFSKTQKAAGDAEGGHTAARRNTFRGRWGVALSGRTRGRTNFGGPIRVILSAVAIFLFAQVVAIFIVALGVELTHPGASSATILDSSTLAQFFYFLIAEGLAAGLVLKLVQRRKIGFSAIGLGRWPSWNDLGWAATGLVGFYALVIVATILLSFFVSQNELDKSQDLGFNNASGAVGQLLTFISLVIIPPIGEETLVRGYLYSGLRKSMRFLPAMLITSFLFGLAHLNGGIGGSLVWAAAVDTFVLSIVLVYLRDKTGALYAGMLIHSVNNLVAYIVHFK